MTTAAPSRNLHDDLRAVIDRTILEHPRSQQRVIGPSEVGTPCVRKLGYKVAQTPAARPDVPGWRPTVGTAVHTWLADAFAAENKRLAWDRWLIETRVTAGTVAGVDVTGTADLFDCLTGTVIDWKVPGVTTIKKARAARDPGMQYRTQVHGYGCGFALMGLTVNHVAIMFLPAAGELADAYLWSEPFDPLVAIYAFQRADAIAAGGAAVGFDNVIPQLPTADDHCAHCPWWYPGARDTRVACPGHDTGQPATHTPTGGAFGRATTGRNTAL